MRVLTRGLPVLTLLGLSVTTARAQSPTTFDACYVPSVGALYLTKLTGLPSQCLATGHVAVSWSNGALADASVTTAKLADGAVTDAKLASRYLPVDGVRAATNGFAVTTSTLGTGTIPATGPGVRLMWYAGKAALRSGETDDAEWDDASIGNFSVATGLSTTASATASTAMGVSTTASGGASTATGFSTTAGGYASTAMGNGTTASGDHSTAMGASTAASGLNSLAIGQSTVVSGINSVAMGQNTTVSGDAAMAMGFHTSATTTAATAMGEYTTASGLNSTAMGEYTTAQAEASLVIGRYNVVAGTVSGWVATDPLLVAGNGTGTGGSASNALTLLKNGNMTIAGTLTQSSDIRLKEDIEPVDRALDGVLRLTPISYRFREGTGHPAERQIGLSAQDVEQVFPELVSQDARGYLSVAYQNLTAVLVRAVQEQQATIASLNQRIARLEARLAEVPVADGRR